MQTGERLRDDPALIRSAERSLDTVIRTVLGHFEEELVALVTGTIARWDAAELGPVVRELLAEVRAPDPVYGSG